MRNLGTSIAPMAWDLGPLVAVLLAAIGLGNGALAGGALLLSALTLGLGWKRAPRVARVTAALFGLGVLFGRGHAIVIEGRWGQESERLMDSEAAGFAARGQDLIRSLQQAARDAAQLKEAPASLSGRPGTRAPLFRALEAQFREARGPALAVHSRDWVPVAWSGRIVELGSLRDLVAIGEDVFVLEGALATTLVAVSPVHDATGGPAGFATAELTLATRRNVQNAYLTDFDRLAGDSGTVEVRYVDRRQPEPSEPVFLPLAPGASFRSATLRAPSGRTIALARVTPPRAERVLADDRAWHRIALWVVAGLTATATLFSAGRTLPRALTAAVLLRVALALLGPPALKEGLADAWSSDIFAPPFSPNTLLNRLAPLLASPLDLALTALCAALAGLTLAERALRPAAAAPRPLRDLICDVAAVPVLGASFAALAETVARSSLDLDQVALAPASVGLLCMQTALLAMLACGLALLVTVFSRAGRFPDGFAPTSLRLAGWVAIFAVASRFWPRERLGLPLLPALLLFAIAALASGRRATLRAWLGGLSPGALAGVALGAISGLSLLLFPSVVHFEEKKLRSAIEKVDAPLVLRQPDWRDYVLREARRKIDEFGLLEDEPKGPRPPELEEQAYAVWSATDLATYGFTSAVEVQDLSGSIVSRFALNLPSIGAARRPMPRSTDWEIARERSTVASAEVPVLHARRLLASDGRVRGAVHVFVGDDYWNLPFLNSRDPYSILFRRAAVSPRTNRPLGLLVFDAERHPVFSSDDHPPTLNPDLDRRVAASPAGLWSMLRVDERWQHVFLLRQGRTTYGVLYPRTAAGRFLADLLESALATLLLGAALLAAIILLRTLLRRDSLTLFSLAATIRQHFSLRLFVAFALVAFVPVIVLQAVLERFVTERLRAQAAEQAQELAGVAKKAVEDFALFQRDEAPGDQPVTDAALVWVASLIRNDLDVFEDGRLLASSKRELYASGLLPHRLSGEAFRAIALDGEPNTLRTEEIGAFSYQVVSVPLRFESGATRVLSIPLALRERELASVVDDLRRTVRLASVGFLLAAAFAAFSMARRISGPVRALTAATERLATGDFEARVRGTTEDELQDLVVSFNRMAEDLLRQRQDLERTNRLAAWAEMARQVAHEVKNPLTPIQLSAEHLRRVYANKSADFGQTLETCTETILKQVRTLRGIVTEFSSFARPPAPVLERVDLAPLAEDVVRQYAPALPAEVSLEVAVAEPLSVMADARLLERAVVNLVENALQAVGDRGRVLVRVIGDGNGRAVIEVQDDGPGLDAEAQRRAFEPFFSTKSGGSGLGLALVKKIAEDHEGGVSIESAPGSPTLARLWLPVSVATPDAPPSAENPAE